MDETVAHGPKKWLRSTRCTRRLAKKQNTYRTPTGVEKQREYMLVNRKDHTWSRDAEANDMIHKGSDHRGVMARFVIPANTNEGDEAKKCEFNEG